MSKIIRDDTNQRMSQIVVHNNTIYLSGQVGNKNSMDVTTQTSEVLKKIEKLLLQAGSNKNKISFIAILMGIFPHIRKKRKIQLSFLAVLIHMKKIVNIYILI